MKIRTGFVSNSSSSSFCIIGVDNKELINLLANAEGKKYYTTEPKDYLHHGMDEGNYVTFYGCDNIPIWVGIDAKKILETKNLTQARKYFVDFVNKHLKVKIPIEEVDLHFGSAGY